MEKQERDPFLAKGKGSIQNRLKILSSKRTIRETAKLWGVSTATLSAYINKGSLPSIQRAYDISIAEGVSLEWLVTGEDTNSLPAIRKTSSDMVDVPEYDVEVSAGNGTFVCEESKVGTFSFPKRWLIENKLTGSALCAIRATGNSMEPVIFDGDTLLIKLVDVFENAAYDSICILRLDGRLFVKRMRYDMGKKGHHIVSENPRYDSIFVPNTEYDERVQVIGVVAGILFKKAPSDTDYQTMELPFDLGKLHSPKE
ncbi:MAG: XRE family transcriptional regulator [Shewanella algae]